MAEKSAALVVDADGDLAASPGDTLEYTVTITNTGGAAATGVTLGDVPDSNTTLVAGSVQTSRGVVTIGNGAGDGSVSIAVGSVTAGNPVTITFRVTINTPLPVGVSQVTNQASVTSAELPLVLTDDPSTPALSDPTITVVAAAPVLTVGKSVSPVGVVQAGAALTYTAVVTNVGTANTDTAVLFDAPPTGSLYIANSTTVNGQPVVDALPGMPPTASGLAVFSPCCGDPGGSSGTLVAGAANQATVTFRALVLSPINNSTVLSNVSTAQTALTPLVTSNTVSNTVFSTATLAVTKVVDPSASVLAGDVLTYTIIVTDTGTMTASNVNVADTVPANTTYVAGSANNGGTFDGTRVSWTNLTVSGAGLGADGLPNTADDVLTPLVLIFQVKAAVPWLNNTPPITNTATATYTGFTDSTPGSASTQNATSNQTSTHR